jgi:hypothetical protein
VAHDAAGLQYGYGLSRDLAIILLIKGSLSGAGRESGQKGKAREDANELNPPIASHCGDVMRFCCVPEV